jgi:hypothetical protein
MLVGTIVVVGVTAAVAGNGVGAVFNLGRTNFVNAVTELRGSTDTQQLLVRNIATTASSAAIVGQTARGTGVWGRSERSGVRGSASAASGVTFGVYGTTASPGGYAGYFQNTSTFADPQTGRGIRALAARASATLFKPGDGAAGGEFAGPNGAIGVAADPNGAGIVGHAGDGRFGVFADSDTDFGVAVRALATSGGGIGLHATTASGIGLAGLFENPFGVSVLGVGPGASASQQFVVRGGGEFIGPIGVTGQSRGAADDGIGVLGLQGAGEYALLTVGDARIQGDLSKFGGTFKIDHPLDPANKYLSHSFVESPDRMNIYNGNVVTDADGVAVVELPSYFEALNRNPRYQLTVIGSFANAQIAEKISENRFTIRTEEPNVEVSWQVTGIRQDAYAQAHPIIVEEEKAVADRGLYLTPAEHGQPASMAIGPHLAARDAPATRME